MNFESWLESRSVDIELFLNELDKKEILLLHFLIECIESEGTSAFFLNEIGLMDTESFYRLARDLAPVRFRNFNKDFMIKTIMEEYQLESYNNVLCKHMYLNSKNSDFTHLNPFMQAIDCFIRILFLRKFIVLKDNFSDSIELNAKSIEKRTLFTNRPITNILGLIVILGKNDREHNIFIMLTNLFNDLEKIKYSRLKASYKKNLIELEKTKRALTKKDELYCKSTEKIKSLNNDLKNFKKQQHTLELNKDSSKLINELKLASIEKDKEIEKLNNTLKIEKDTCLNYRLKWNAITKEVENYKTQLKRNYTTIDELKRKLEDEERKSIKTRLTECFNEQENVDELVTFIESLLSDYKLNKENKQTKESEVPQQNQDDKTGYCLIENNKHYVVFSDGSKKLLKDIPESLYLSKYQFVKVKSDGTFKWIYKSVYKESLTNYSATIFGEYKNRNNAHYILKPNGTIMPIKNLSPKTNLIEGQIISTNSKGEFLRYYPFARHSLDNCFDSISAKGQEVFYILKIFPNGMMLRNIQTNTEEFRTVELNDFELEEQRVICLKGNKVINAFSSSKFYTLSSFYKNTQHGVVQILNGTPFIKKVSEEIVLINDLPLNIDLKDGDLIVVDEFNNFIRIQRNVIINDTAERKKLISNYKTPATKRFTETIEVTDDILIIGKITYENSYKMTFYKNGYAAHVVDGYESWAKIKSAIKGKSAVVIVTQFCSHDVMWKIKDEELDIPVIFSEHDGANRILDDVQSGLLQGAQ